MAANGYRRGIAEVSQNGKMAKWQKNRTARGKNSNQTQCSSWPTEANSKIASGKSRKAKIRKVEK